MVEKRKCGNTHTHIHTHTPHKICGGAQRRCDVYSRDIYMYAYMCIYMQRYLYMVEKVNVEIHTDTHTQTPKNLCGETL